MGEKEKKYKRQWLWWKNSDNDDDYFANENVDFSVFDDLEVFYDYEGGCCDGEDEEIEDILRDEFNEEEILE